jgi:DNA polymerase-3 subunit epsilon
MREVVLDTETTGLDPASGHRIVEIGCVEIIRGVKSGAFFHTYLNPERDVPDEASRVHGLKKEFLKDKPVFSEKVDAFLEFIGQSPLIIHNAGFDMKFVNAELNRLGFASIPMNRAVDTLMIARKKFPGSPASLDALCKRFEIDLSARTHHGALLDSELLAEVYLELLGGRQVTLALEAETAGSATLPGAAGEARAVLEPRAFPPSAEELAAHVEMLAKLKKPVWEEYAE